MQRAPSTTSLLCLEASARLRSFTAAAKELNLSQGAVSRQIIALEARLGVSLFIRRRDALTLTEAGRYYLEEVGPFLQRLERATANVMVLKGRGGSLALSVGASVGSYWLIPRLVWFTRNHSEITLDLATRVGAVDFTVSPVHASLEFGEGVRMGLHNEFVLPLVLSPYAAPSWIARHGKTLTLATPRTELLQHRSVPEAWREWFRLSDLGSDPGAQGPRYDVMTMAFNAAVAGMGAVLLPKFMTGDAVASGRLKPLSRRAWRSSKGYYLVYPKESDDLKALQTLRKWLLEQAAETPT